MAECRFGCGCHIHPDMAYAEILDAEGKPAPPGEAGMLVVTTLNSEGTPLIRYRTGDITSVRAEPCQCGRQSPRIGPILAREGQMLKIKGTKVYPTLISDLLATLPGVEDFVILADHDEHGSDRARVLVALAPESGATEKSVGENLYAALRIHPLVETAARERIAELALPAGYRKKRAFIDQRGAGA